MANKEIFGFKKVELTAQLILKNNNFSFQTNRKLDSSELFNIY